MTEREEYLYCVFLSRFTLSHTQVRRGSLLSFGRCVCLCMCRRWRTCLVCVRVCLLYGYGRMYWWYWRRWWRSQPKASLSLSLSPCQSLSSFRWVGGWIYIRSGKERERNKYIKTEKKGKIKNGLERVFSLGKPRRWVNKWMKRASRQTFHSTSFLRNQCQYPTAKKGGEKNSYIHERKKKKRERKGQQQKIR